MDTVLTMRGIVKEFPGVRALDHVDLEVRAGEVHCLLGQNGAGKSTLIKVLSGAHQPDGGELHWLGRPLRLSGPAAATRLGIATIYQELDLCDGLSIAENIFLGHEHARGGFTRRAPAARATTELLGRLGHAELHPDTAVGTLPAAAKQVVSIARALSYDARLIVMDEPSAALGNDEVANLFRIIAQLRAEGVAVVYISHRLDEIRTIGDRITVLKDGRTVAAGLPARTTGTEQVVSLMTGRGNLELQAPRVAPAAAAPEVLRVTGLGLSGRFHDVSFTVHAGEIVGLAGLVGAGRSEILETIYGARRPSSGQILVDGHRIRPGSTTAAVAAGLGLAPEERKSQALFLLESVGRNISAASLPRFSRFGWFDRRRERADAGAALGRVGIRPSDPAHPVRELSGGNQQKAILARWLLDDCRVLLLDEPTRGVDVGARADVYAQIHRLADQGVAVLLVSSDLPELLGLSDRVLVLRDGAMIHAAPAAELTEHDTIAMIMEGSAL
ncbi:putative sugar ABC transporter ATP-binding protein [Nocardia brasiliensis NBRC 14402]|uniref:sugar ABC transporter ATP-binding protein n=1 Tax=Nocardia brasiliensis TaxID=37326 RepID=UPI0002DB3457|nr:sugar ABC transporter ATP-binding protein [Nocardia brasiliensis]ASF11589.1 sugar ABC transporter ATP-binding protein [Nocardia brasiliensis]GAJ82671.1 putative sugar ABC transporter ATP-binding protein [Nocardia brasiliensis NBRC 14402]SUB09628.1 Arabinose import ATP-binding protein AraG [Nocardia brasiliensis]